MGGKQAGCIGLLSVIAADCEVMAVVAYDDIMREIADKLNISTFKSIKDEGVIELLQNCDLLISTHGREIVPPSMLETPILGCINVHPCLYKYKGANPIEQLIQDNNTKASVGIHYMTELVDSGEVILEKFVDVSGKNNVEEIYNELYPYYMLAIIEAIDKIRNKL